MSRAYQKRPPDRTPAIRRAVQIGFLLINAWIGWEFYRWVRFYESGGATRFVARPDGVDGWLPIAGLMNLRYVMATHAAPAVHPAGLVLIVAFLAISIVFRKAFCGWLCPIGTVSEWLWRGGRELFGRTLALPRWADTPLRSLKYLLLLFFLVIVGQLSTDDLASFLASPYGVIADVKMLNFFRHAGDTTVAVCSILVVLSVASKNVWCRYLCPYGALMGLVSLASPVRIVRDANACIDCGRCAAACPSLIPVDTLSSVRTPECNACLTCVSACPVQDALDLRTLPRRRRVGGPAVALGIVVVLALLIGYARMAGLWHTATPDPVLFELIPAADAIGH